MKYGMVETGGKGGIPGGVGDVIEGTKPWITFYVQSDNLASSLAQAEKLGGKTILSPKQLPGGPAIAAFEDPEGHVVGLVNELAA
jgi:hypothetical protein